MEVDEVPRPASPDTSNISGACQANFQPAPLLPDLGTGSPPPKEQAAPRSQQRPPPASARVQASKLAQLSPQHDEDTLDQATIQATLKELEALARALEDRDAEKFAFRQQDQDFEMELADDHFDWDAVWDSTKLRWLESAPTLHL